MCVFGVYLQVWINAQSRNRTYDNMFNITNVRVYVGLCVYEKRSHTVADAML